ncbi:MAG: 50S ribosomal protein L3 [Nanohaloarchaea archaeon]|nr:50S ribosomal protein L3 [Candidatus Nanohaloarchaea archaeon]
MGRVHHPRRGSLAFRPKTRAKRIYPTMKTLPAISETKIQEFAGYKVGMTHVTIVDNRKGSVTYNQEISVPVTVMECPNLKVLGIRTYSRGVYGTKAISESLSVDNSADDLKRAGVHVSKVKSKDLKEDIDSIAEVRLIVYTRPTETGVSKKTPEVFEVTVSGNNTEEKLKLAEDKLGKELAVSEIFNAGETIDVRSVTKGKGFSGQVKRYGVKLLAKKSEKVKRKPGNLGPFHPHKTSWTVAQAGNLGFNNRTELNKMIVKIGEKDLDIKGGWLNYGNVKSNYIMLKGSVPGPCKRLVRFRAPVRPQKYKYDEPQVTYVSLESKQGI